MDDLFGIRSKKANSDALVANQLDDEISVDSNDIELYKESLVKNEIYRTSHVDNVEDQFNFEGSTDDILSPNQNPNELSRYRNNIMAYVSPSMKRLHDGIIRNSPSRVRHHNAASLSASRKNMISIIDYIIRIGDIEEDPQSAFLFDDMKKLFKSISWNYNKENYHNLKHHPEKE